MEPRIQYAKTSDGVNIAYAVFGTGPPIVFPSSILGSIHLYKEATFGVRAVSDELVSRGWSVITYDGRGCGSSDRDPADYTLEGRLRDLEAVIERVAPSRFALCGIIQGGPASVAYAVQEPDRVTHLILSNTFARGSDWYELVPAMRISQQMLPTAEDEREFHFLTLANAVTGYADSQQARRLAETYRSGMSTKAYVAYREASEEMDMRDLLSQIAIPTLVVHDRSIPMARLGEVVQRLAPLIPDARFVETDNLASVIDEFLREGEQAETKEERLPSGMTAILFADIANSTALTERLGDAAFRDKARELDGALRTIIRENAGRPIEGKLLGDGVLAVFTSARQAIGAALACARAGDDAGLPLHLGLHAGDVIREENNVYGGAVNIASRISGLSAPGAVLVSETVRSLARTSAGVTFEDRGEQSLKGVGELVRVWAVLHRIENG